MHISQGLLFFSLSMFLQSRQWESGEQWTRGFIIWWVLVRSAWMVQEIYIHVSMNCQKKYSTRQDSFYVLQLTSLPTLDLVGTSAPWWGRCHNWSREQISTPRRLPCKYKVSTFCTSHIFWSTSSPGRCGHPSQTRWKHSWRSYQTDHFRSLSLSCNRGKYYASTRYWCKHL